jgi:hypothetical protein
VNPWSSGFLQQNSAGTASAIISIVSLLIAISAIAVAVWHVRTAKRVANKANSLPVVTTLFDQFRSEAFQEHIEVILTTQPDPSSWPEPSEWPHGHSNPGFGGELRRDKDPWRWSALQVAYFFEYLGVLVAHRLIPTEIVVDATANVTARTWAVIEPFIRAERARREKIHAGNPRVSRGFVRHYEHLVALTTVNDKPADEEIQKKLALKQVPGTGPAGAPDGN